MLKYFQNYHVHFLITIQIFIVIILFYYRNLSKKKLRELKSFEDRISKEIKSLKNEFKKTNAPSNSVEVNNDKQNNFPINQDASQKNINKREIMLGSEVELFYKKWNKKLKISITQENDKKDESKLFYKDELAKLILGKKIGDKVTFNRDNNDIEIEILKVDNSDAYPIPTTIPTDPNEKESPKINFFEDIYKKIHEDIAVGKIKIIGNTPVCVIDGKIRFGNDKRTEKKENIKLLFNHFKQNKIKKVPREREQWFSLITKLTKGKTKTIDYNYYADFIQEMLNRYYSYIRR